MDRARGGCSRSATAGPTHPSYPGLPLGAVVVVVVVVAVVAAGRTMEQWPATWDVWEASSPIWPASSTGPAEAVPTTWWRPAMARRVLAMPTPVASVAAAVFIPWRPAAVVAPPPPLPHFRIPLGWSPRPGGAGAGAGAGAGVLVLRVPPWAVVVQAVRAAAAADSRHRTARPYPIRWLGSRDHRPPHLPAQAR